jgi:hypothetical protein
MFQNLNLYQDIQLSGGSYAENIHARQYNTALNRFKATLAKGKVFRLKRRVLRRPQFLYDLSSLKSALSLRGSCYSGIQVVPIGSIIGSEGRVADFDIDFHPIRETARERWVNMAIVYLSRLPLPPIELIRVGDAFFVRDGHHRISVGRAFGQISMDAEVTTWKAEPPFPWQPELLRERPQPLASFDLSM